MGLNKEHTKYVLNIVKDFYRKMRSLIADISLNQGQGTGSSYWAGTHSGVYWILNIGAWTVTQCFPQGRQGKLQDRSNCTHTLKRPCCDPLFKKNHCIRWHVPLLYFMHVIYPQKSPFCAHSKVLRLLLGTTILDAMSATPANSELWLKWHSICFSPGSYSTYKFM